MVGSLSNNVIKKKKMMLFIQWLTFTKTVSSMTTYWKSDQTPGCSPLFWRYETIITGCLGTWIYGLWGLCGSKVTFWLNVHHNQSHQWPYATDVGHKGRKLHIMDTSSPKHRQFQTENAMHGHRYSSSGMNYTLISIFIHANHPT